MLVDRMRSRGKLAYKKVSIICFAGGPKARSAHFLALEGNQRVISC